MPLIPRARKTRYTQVALPTELVDAVRKTVNDPNSFYTSLADLVKEALREKLERIRLSKAALSKPKKPSSTGTPCAHSA